MRKILLGLCGTVVCIALVAGVTTSAAFGYKAMKKIGDVNSTVETLSKDVTTIIDGSQDVAKEDDVKIGGQYTILSTKNISDAYISGKTDGLSDVDKETLKMASDIIKEIIKDDMSDYEKELAVYEWLTMYPKQGGTEVIGDVKNSSTPYGVLKTRNAVCVGYATTFRLFMQMLGIDCKVVHSTDLSHSWDLVKLEGQWYHTDCYFDAGTANHKGFNMDDNVSAQSHDWNREFFPAAAGIKYSYAYLNAQKINDVLDIPKEIKKVVKEKDTAAFFLIKGKDEEDLSQQALIAETISDQINNNFMSVFGTDGYVEYSWMPIDSNTKVFGMFFNKYNQNATSLDEKTQQKVIDALEKAFDNIGWGILNPEY